jgi:hypothetical protein
MRIVLLALLGVGLGFPPPAFAQHSRCAACHFANMSDVPAPEHLGDYQRSAHAKKGVGCERCHGGDPSTFEPALAHRVIVKTASTIHDISAAHVVRELLDSTPIETVRRTVIAAVEAVTDRKVDAIVGKPSPIILEVALQALGCPASDSVIVGDRIETDMVMGRRMGLATILVLSGVTRPDDPRIAALAPDHVLRSVRELIA